jgi:hypothetical protein
VRTLLFVVLSLIVSTSIISCSSTATYNPTVFPYEYQPTDKPIKKVILAPVSLGAPPPSHLSNSNSKIKARIKDYLESNGYEILPSYPFENAWKQASRTYGNVYDPSTGKIDINAWRGAMITTGEKLREQTDADAIIFADVFEHEVQHDFSMNHYARWYGITRKPSLQGSGTGVPLDFNWGQQIKAASLMVTIYDLNLTRIFNSRGGIDTLESVDLKRATPAFVRSKKLLKNDDHIEEGIELAFHPFIVMQQYPGEQK